MRILLARAVHTMEPGAAVADAIAVEGGRIAAVGTRHALVRAHPTAPLEDLGERAVVPGFVDAHHHLALRCTLSTGADCTPAAAGSLDALLGRLRAAAQALPEGAWVLGWGYDEMQLRERRHPTRSDLDAACPAHPVLLLHYGCHEAVASSRALALAGIDRHTPDPASGQILHDRRGDPDGRLVETAYAPVERLALPDRLARSADEVIARLASAQDALLRVGITHIADPTVPSAVAAIYERARARGLLRVGVTGMPVSERGMLVTPWDRLDSAPRTGDGDEALATGPLKIVFDGATRCAMCATGTELVRLVLAGFAATARSRSLDVARTLAEGRPRRERGAWRTGISFVEGDDARRLVALAVDAGFGVAIHAIGNAANDEALAAIRASRARHREDPPPRIEHALFLRRDQPGRIAEAGITVVTQPAFIGLRAFDLMRLPSSFLTFPLRSLLDAGVHVAGSSDAPVATFDPLDAMRAAVWRQTASGHVLGPDERIEPSQALALYTREAARACGVLGARGTLAPGKRADLVVLSCDPLATPNALREAKVERTLLAGADALPRT